jgi:hypothetical protein
MSTATRPLNSFVYVGNELDLFARAVRWKLYWAGQIRRYLGTRIAEIGAGIGTNVGLLAEKGQDWTCVEPDPALASRITARVLAGASCFVSVQVTDPAQ